METVSKGKQITGEARAALADEIKAAYERGAAVRDIAEQTGRSYGWVHRVLSEAGVEFRARGGSVRGAPRKPRKLSDAQQREYGERIRQGATGRRKR